MAFVQKGVLLGLAEVKIPFRHLSREDRNEISQLCYKKLLDIPTEEDESTKCIGVVDSFYALQEITLTIEGDTCKLFKNFEVILQHNLRNVLCASLARDHPSRVIVVSQTKNFGRTAVVLELFDKAVATKLIEILIQVRRKMSTEKLGHFRRAPTSFGKSVHRKLNSFLSTLSQQTDFPQHGDTLNRSASAPVSPRYLSEEEDDDRYSDEEYDDSSSDGHDTILPASPSPSPRQSVGALGAELEFLLSSEFQYLESLKDIQDKRKQMGKCCWRGCQRHQFIFRGVEELCNLHQKLYSDLATGRTESDIAHVLLRHTNDFEIYVSFISNVPLVDRAAAAEKEHPKDNCCDVFENLRKPRMRLNYYVLTMEGLLKHCSADDREVIQKCIEMLKGWLKEADTRLVLDSIKDAPFELRNFGLVTLFGELTLKRGPGLQRKRYQVLLLDTLLVLAEGRSDNCEYVGYFQLSRLEMVHQMRGLYFHMKLSRSEKSHTIIFKAKTVKMQQKWIQTLNNQINKVKLSSPKSSCNEERLLTTKSQVKSNFKIPDITIDSYDNVVHSDFPLVPPLSFWTALSQVAYSHEYENEYNFETCLLRLERIANKFINNFQAICQRCEKQLESLSLLRHFYISSLIPSIQSYFQDIHVHLLHNANEYNLSKSISKLFYYFAVKTYESDECCPNELLITIESLLCLRHTVFCDNRFTDKDTEVSVLNKLFDDIINNTNDKLKRRYISNMPNISSKIVYEGILHLSSIHDGEDYWYGVLTEVNLFIFSIESNQFSLEKSIDIKNGRLGHPPGISSFQLVLKNEIGSKVKINCQCPTLRQKNDWIAAFDQVFNKQRKTSLDETNQKRRRLSYDFFRKVPSAPLLESQL